MKGEIFHMCSIITAAKEALHTRTFIQYEPFVYENGITFRFLPERDGEEREDVHDVESWYAKCAYNGMEDIKIMIPMAAKNRMLLGVPNTMDYMMLCFYPNDEVRLWLPYWSMDKERKGWNILYQENGFNDHPPGKPKYEDNSEAFIKSLNDIIGFAREIGCDNWAEIFSQSIEMLDGKFDFAANDSRIEEGLRKMGRAIVKKRHLNLPQHNFNMFEAALNANAFGREGSWNDVPARMAHEKERDRDYNELSDKLYEQLTRATMYAINEY